MSQRVIGLDCSSLSVCYFGKGDVAERRAVSKAIVRELL